MATTRVHEDQENRITDIRRGKENLSLPQNQTLLPSKRAVLASLHNNCHQNTKLEICKDEKYPLSKTFVPAQFESFKIYEDKNEAKYPIYADREETKFKIYEDKLEEETSVALRHSKDIQANIIDQTTLTNGELNKSGNKLDDHDNLKESPMSLDKSLNSINTNANRSRFKKIISKEYRSTFFDVDEYRADIYNYLRTAETQHRPKPGYMKKQPDITYSMRSILVDWLVEVTEEYKLQTETLYLAVSYIDRFLSYMSVVRAKLQLVGTAAMFIAAKYEEIYPPDVGEFVYITDDTYSKKQVLRMEHLILRVLSFDVTIPTPLTFLKHYCISNNLSDKIQFLAMYLCELTMLEADMYMQYLPSQLAASGIALARYTLHEEVWPHELELSTGYSLIQLRDIIINLKKIFVNVQKMPQQAIQDKYKSSKYGHIALILPRNTHPFDCDDESGESA